MKYFFIVLYAILLNSAFAGSASPLVCFQACKHVAGEGVCHIESHDGTGAVMIIDAKKGASRDFQAQVLSVRDCFFAAGGAFYEYHVNDFGRIMQCQPSHRGAVCDNVEAKYSIRQDRHGKK